MTTLLTLARVRRNGTFTTGSYDVPVNITGYFRVLSDIHPTDYINIDVRLAFRLYKLNTVTGLWVLDSGFSWSGGANIVDGISNPTPSLLIPAADIAGKTIRAEIDSPSNIRVGCLIQHGTEAEFV